MQHKEALKLKTLLMLIILIIVEMAARTKQEDFVSRKFSVVGDVEIESNYHLLTRQKVANTRMRCTSLCIQSACECMSFVFDDNNKTCHMFSKTLISGNGDQVGYNKITECATPRQISNAIVMTYTGCNATYNCNHGYHRMPTSINSSVITCQEDETWAPSDYQCVPILVKYYIELETGTLDGAGTDANVHMVLYGQWGSISISFPSSMDFENGSVDKHDVTKSNIGKLTKIDIGHDDSGPFSPWYLQSVHIEVNDVTYSLSVGMWLIPPDIEISLSVT